MWKIQKKKIIRKTRRISCTREGKSSQKMMLEQLHDNINVFKDHCNIRLLSSRCILDRSKNLCIGLRLIPVISWGDVWEEIVSCALIHCSSCFCLSVEHSLEVILNFWFLLFTYRVAFVWRLALEWKSRNFSEVARQLSLLVFYTCHMYMKITVMAFKM